MGTSRASRNFIYKAMGQAKYVAETAIAKAKTPRDSSGYDRVGNQLVKKQPKPLI